MKKVNVPYFLWDYDLNEKEVKAGLKSGSDSTRLFLIARILESAKYEDIWRYLTLNEILAVFPRLKLKPPIKNAWEVAFKAWHIVNYSYGKPNATAK
ncbi:hypothetical protein A2690_00895 [Candidatus Roizmanbacteria bacterium RIFCSPHIGHO2_01_FULL_39_12b]|uniref:Uncharacterized protein n=1 Tax=Candidatus Roizmanbacteria bacterium RIFCSPHIGHO2_01_FULL_39_12b TaxID=1802030 RepID=A0A1F7GB33_9BACT|nr:MAG: hypothetical protein A2690_00895 [Candidatus Roizmanbacteria bacterium RIFCSPHIGHO2_01_FULL_39_12b]